MLTPDSPAPSDAAPGAVPSAATPPEPPAAPAEFLDALFDPNEVILVRPIETWTEDGRKRSRVLYKKVRHLRPRDLAHPNLWAALLAGARSERANLFFGVCPRFGPGGRYDLAFQIRTVRALWLDVDHCTVEEALRRIEGAGLPKPSVVVHSGNGVHLYWLLTEPYRIDDAGEPPPVWKEFLDQGPGKKKKVRQYLSDPVTKAKKYDLPDVSPKGQHIQEILAGMAAQVGGDHTQDLARLLRLPGTLNRKDERNGRTPVPCELVECDPGRRYPLEEFERFAAQAPAKEKSEAARRVRLPAGKRLTPTRRNRLNDFINACLLTEVGGRSEADFALCAWAVEQGLGRDEVWGQVQDVGKFGERGREYFDRTWESAEEKVRQKVYDRACRRAGVRPAKNGPANGAPPPPRADPPVSGDNNDLPPPHSAEAGAEGEGSDANEAPDDPHRLARLWRQGHGNHPDGPTVRYYREEFWRWGGRHWRSVPDAEMRCQLAAFCKRQLDFDNRLLVETWSGDGPPPFVPKVTRELVANVAQALGGDVLLPREAHQPCWLDDSGPQRRQFLAVANGLLDVDALLAGRPEVLHPHTPRWFTPVSQTYAFDPDADCPRWRAFLERNLAADAGKCALLQQFAGYLLLPDTSLQRFLLMIGEGSNGKSVVCAVLRALLGAANVCSVSLEKFGERFELAETLGKLANVVAEVGELDRVAEGQLKAYVTGDPILFERKFKAPFAAEPTARLVLATNNPPQFSDKSDGIWRRMLVLKFTVQIPEDEKIAGMDKVEHWEEEGELPGILNWALAGLADLRKAGRFVTPPACQEEVEQLRGDCNPARRFLREHYEAGGGEVPTADLYAAYKEWSGKNGHYPLAESNFGKEVLRAFPRVEKRRIGGRGLRFHVYAGVIPRED